MQLGRNEADERRPSDKTRVGDEMLRFRDTDVTDLIMCSK